MYEISFLFWIIGFVLGFNKTSTNPDLYASFNPDTKSSLNSKPGSQKFALKSNHPLLTFFELKSIDLIPFC